jgi:hypothetical protein
VIWRATDLGAAMRRFLLLGALVAALLPFVGAPSAGAATERYQSQTLNAFWHTKKVVDPDTYRRTTWYAGVYGSGDNFWSDLYKEVQRCQVREGPDRCREVSFAYGAIRDIGDGSFWVNRRLSAGHLEATYRMHTDQDGERVPLGPAHIVADLTGRGDVSRSHDLYVNHSNCDHFLFSGQWLWRRALASGTLDFRGVEGKDLGTTRDAGMGRGQEIEIEHSC